MNKNINLDNFKFIEVEKPNNNLSFFDLKKKILNKEQLNNSEINKIWCIIAFFIVLFFLIYELCNLEYLK